MREGVVELSLKICKSGLKPHHVSALLIERIREIDDTPSKKRRRFRLFTQPLRLIERCPVLRGCLRASNGCFAI